MVRSNAVAFAEIKCHGTSFIKIVDDFGYELATSYNTYNDGEFRKIQEEVNVLPDKIRDEKLK